jgi:hypothetical protein
MLITILACNFPTATNTPNQADAQYTAAAETVSAIQTLNALLGTTEPTQSSATAQPSDTPTITPSPTVTNTRQPTTAPTTAICDRAAFVSDITVEDGSDFSAGEDFTKTWRLMNNGSCSWNTNYQVVFDHGDKMGAPGQVNLPKSVAPGQTVDISVPMEAPSSEGDFKGYWMLRNASDDKFGIGADGNKPFWVDIDVVAPAGSTEIFNFVDEACDSNTQWFNDSGDLPCPGESDDAEGFVIILDDPKTETGNKAGADVLETHPQWIDNGYIAGKYDEIDVKSGYRFRTKIGCLYKDGGSACDVKFALKYRIGSDSTKTLAEWAQTYDGSLKTIDLDLSSLAGNSVRFTLVVYANGSSGQDWAVWVNPRIVK